MNTQAPETQYYFDIVKETAAEYVVRALNGSMHQLNKRVLRNADHNFKALLHPSTRIEEAPQELSGFISFFAEAALSFSFPEKDFSGLTLCEYEPCELHTGSWSSAIRQKLLEKGAAFPAARKILFDICARFSYGEDLPVICDFECDTRSREDQFARLNRYLACTMAGSLIAGLDDYRQQVPCLAISISSTCNVVRFAPGTKRGTHDHGIYLIGHEIRDSRGRIHTNNSIMYLIIQLPDVAEYLTRRIKETPRKNVFEDLPAIFKFAAWFCGLTELDAFLQSDRLFSDLKENEMQAIRTNRNTVSDYSEYDWKTQQSLRVKDKELKLKDRELEKNAQELKLKDRELEKNAQELELKDRELEKNAQELELKDRELEKNAQELDRMALFCLNTLRDKSDAVIMQTLGWSQAQLDKYRAMASRQ